MNRLLKKSEKGFTLLEVMLVVLIIGIIAVIALPKLLVTRTTAAEKSCKSNLQAIRTQVEAYNWNTGAYPLDLPAILADPVYFPAGSTASNLCPSDGVTAYTYDAAAGSVTCSIHPNN